MFIVAADNVVDGAGDLAASQRAVDQLTEQGARIVEFEISASSDGWQTELPENRLRCAAAPMIAISRGRAMMAAGEIDAIVIRGREHLKSDYLDNKEERNRLMQIYGEGKGAVLDGYEKLAQSFLKHWDVNADDFRSTSEAIFENYWRVWQAQNPEAKRPADTWFDLVTPMFRGVDCANPSIDYDGCLVIASAEMCKKTDFGLGSYSEILGCDIQQQTEDGPEFVEEIVSYDHISTSYANACAEADVDFSAAFLGDKAMLDIYSCYSVVPMGFLLATGMVESYGDIAAFAESYPLTITGGLNLAKAPWNNTTMQSIAHTFHALKSDQTPDLAGIHSVGALGYLQAFMILKKVPAYQ